jgi:hypothetical protein
MSRRRIALKFLPNPVLRNGEHPVPVLILTERRRSKAKARAFYSCAAIAQRSKRKSIRGWMPGSHLFEVP